MTSRLVSVELPPDALEFMKAEAERSNRSLADVLRRAIATYKFLKEQQQLGSALLVQARGAPVATPFKVD